MASTKLRQRKPLSYKGYLMLDDLLTLQAPVSRPEQHDEMLFVVSHQTYELWFKQMLRELDAALAAMQSDEPREAARLIRRVVTIVKVLTQQLEVLETIRPTDFLKFRNALRPASGFQSTQFREIEFLSGHKDARFLELHKEDQRARTQLERRFQAESLWDAFRSVLAKRRLLKVRAAVSKVEGRLLRGEVGAIVRVYSSSAYSDVAELAEALLEYDKHFWLWRNHHVGMVERIIGRKVGTGSDVIAETVGPYYFDTAGVAYLKTTLRRRFFPALWAARTKFKEN